MSVSTYESEKVSAKDYDATISEPQEDVIVQKTYRMAESMKKASSAQIDLFRLSKEENKIGGNWLLGWLLLFLFPSCT